MPVECGRRQQPRTGQESNEIGGEPRRRSHGTNRERVVPGAPGDGSRPVDRLAVNGDAPRQLPNRIDLEQSDTTTSASSAGGGAGPAVRLTVPVEMPSAVAIASSESARTAATQTRSAWDLRSSGVNGLPDIP